jgi:glycosyltransferase involved in cell wall biosynthesis
MMPFGPKEEATPAAANLKAPVLLSLFVACYNEQDNIIGTLETLVGALQRAGPSFDIIVVDDASKDDSVPRIRKFMADNPQLPIRLLLNGHNEGVATNYAEGAFRAKGEWYRMICGDNVESEETLSTIFRSIGEAEMLVPYYVEHPGRAAHRQIISKLYTGLVNLLSGYRLHYYNGMPLTRRAYAMRWHSNSHGFGFQADLVTRLLALGATHKEVGVIGRERAGGKSSALTFRNLASVAHSLQNIAIRRVSKFLYGYC